MLYEKLDNHRVRCGLCAHQCKIASSQYGICGVRQNRDGVLTSRVYGQAIAANVDPIEKKPLYHFFPGSFSFSVATVGCNFKCGFCQNWQISQVSPKDDPVLSPTLMPEDIVKEARGRKCLSISYTYTEPTVFFEYAYDTARLAKTAGLYNNFVTNGYMTKPALKMISPYLDAANVDLKSFSDDFYRQHCRARLKPVLDSIKLMKELGIWVEVTTLIIPGQNDSEAELKNIAEFIAGVGQDIPWHISRFHPDYQFLNYPPTPVEVLKKAQARGKKAGLRYVYLGNILENSDTCCYNCGKILIKRLYLDISENKIKNGRCSSCGTAVDGAFLI